MTEKGNKINKRMKNIFKNIFGIGVGENLQALDSW